MNLLASLFGVSSTVWAEVWTWVMMTAIVLLVSSGCAPVGYIDSAAVDGPMTRIIQRHQVYVENDPELDDLDRRVFLRDGVLVQRILDEARRGREGGQ